MTDHNYALSITWTGNTGEGTKTLRSYSRNHEVASEGLGTIAGSSDPSFRGDPSRWNPEQLYLASIAQCHMLWYLALAAKEGVTVLNYKDGATGRMIEEENGAGQFESVTLHPVVVISSDSDALLAEELHERVGDYCFIARSIQTPIYHRATIERAS
ncbi:OsmC family protein [Cryobacterium sp. TMT4-31]|uniref:OsmC family protein n=1 Tax=Cryobacterium sp. TMT4-31 TaxID=1259259 RepID=UPI00106B76C3|nr:OsmC family protein [Cryobacterium sp. TMT4-31]TFC87434.1 OsmC family peroxiredoxin [Cryobacterium sp. TMT4-31]